MIRDVLAWFPMLINAVANGALREFTYAKVLPELRAHQLSTLIGSVLMGFFIWLVNHTGPRLPAAKRYSQGSSGSSSRSASSSSWGWCWSIAL